MKDYFETLTHKPLFAGGTFLTFPKPFSSASSKPTGATWPDLI